MPRRLCYMRLGTYSFLKLYPAPHTARRLFRIECVVSLTGSRVEEEKKRVGARRRWMNSRIVAAAWHSTVRLVWVSADLVYCCFTYILIWMINFRARRIYDCRRRDLLSFPTMVAGVLWVCGRCGCFSISTKPKKSTGEINITKKNWKEKVIAHLAGCYNNKEIITFPKTWWHSVACTQCLRRRGNASGG